MNHVCDIDHYGGIHDQPIKNLDYSSMVILDHSNDILPLGPSWSNLEN